MTAVVRLVRLMLLGAILSLTACGGGGSDGSSASPSTEPEAATTAPTTAGGGTPGDGDPRAGEIVFVNEGCGGCHSLRDAGVIGSIDDEGSIGPDLDESQPTYEELVEIVTNGRGAMPSFGGDISEQDIRDVSAYVAEVAGT